MAKADLVLADGLIALPEGRLVEGWVAVVGGTIAAIGTGNCPTASETVDCGGDLLLPGLVDIHTHFRDPGAIYKEDFLSGSTAAAYGGVTTVVDMPNTGNLVRTPEDLAAKISYISGRSYVDYALYALLHDASGRTADFKQLGVAGFKWMMGYEVLNGVVSQPSNRIELRDGLRAAAEADILVGVHAESLAWRRELTAALQAEGRTDPKAHGDSRPPFVEALGVAEAAILGSEYGCRIHIHHLTSGRALSVASLLRSAPSLNLTIEVCPQHLYLDQNDVVKWGTQSRVNPPIRARQDIEALWTGIAEGEVDVIATDHAPHALDEKIVDSIWDAKSGLLGVETLFPKLFNEVHRGRLTLGRFLQLTCERPSEILGLDRKKGKLLPGMDADVLVVDPDDTTTIRGSSLHSKHPYTLFEGDVCQGKIRNVFLRGNRIIDDKGRLCETPQGQYVPAGIGP